MYQLVQLVAGAHPISDFIFMLAYRFERKLYRIVVKNTQGWDFPAGPAVKTQNFHCRAHGVYSWFGN